MWKLPPTSRRRIEIYRNALDASRDARGLAQLNHPNFQGHRAWLQPIRVE